MTTLTEAAENIAALELKEVPAIPFARSTEELKEIPDGHS